MEKLTVLKRGHMTANVHLKNAIDYIFKPAKTKGGLLTGAINCNLATAYDDMMNTKKRFGKESDKPSGKKLKRQGYHWKISFSEYNLTPEQALEVIKEFAEQYLGSKGFEVAYSVHNNTDHIHGHIVFNSVNRITGKKYHDMKGDWEKLMTPVLDEICAKHGIALTRKRSLKKQQQRSCWSKMIRRDLDTLVMVSPSFESLLSKLEDMGYEINTENRMHPTIRPPGMTRHRRFDTLGEDYTVERLKERILTEKYLGACNNDRAVSHPVKFARFGRNRRTKLTGLRKKYFARLYRIGILKKRSYSQAWQYRDDIRHMKELQEEYLFLHKYGITTLRDLTVKKEAVQERRKAVSEEKSRLYKQRAGFKTLFDILDKLGEVVAGANCFQRGEEDFIDEHEEYELLEAELRKEGYTREHIAEIREYYRERISEVIKQEKDVRKEEKIIAAIEKDIEQSRIRNSDRKDDIREREIYRQH